MDRVGRAGRHAVDREHEFRDGRQPDPDADQRGADQHARAGVAGVRGGGPGRGVPGYGVTLRHGVQRVPRHGLAAVCRQLAEDV